LLALVLVGLGLTSLSMAPACLPPVRHALSTHTLDRCRDMAKAAREADDAAAARESVRRLASLELLALL
jgi:phosphoenolpyruvate-protein phosphotransferase (PTS system enzyme I)